MHNSAWLHGESAVPLCSWMSTCSTTLSPSTSLWTSVYFLLHQLSWLQPPRTRPRYCHNTPFLTGRPSPPLSCVSPPDTSCEPLMLILQSTSCSPVISSASTAIFLVLCADLQTSHLNMISGNNTSYRFKENKEKLEILHVDH